MRVALVFAGLLALGACAQTGGANSGGQPPLPSRDLYPTGIDDSCGATAYAVLIGQDATALERILILREVRVIRPGSIVTQDYKPQRLNFRIDDSGRVAELTCG